MRSALPNRSSRRKPGSIFLGGLSRALDPGLRWDERTIACCGVLRRNIIDPAPAALQLFAPCAGEPN
jgi:hypothetical protein